MDGTPAAASQSALDELERKLLFWLFSFEGRLRTLEQSQQEQLLAGDIQNVRVMPRNGNSENRGSQGMMKWAECCSTDGVRDRSEVIDVQIDDPSKHIKEAKLSFEKEVRDYSRTLERSMAETTSKYGAQLDDLKLALEDLRQQISRSQVSVGNGESTEEAAKKPNDDANPDKICDNGADGAGDGAVPTEPAANEVAVEIAPAPGATLQRRLTFEKMSELYLTEMTSELEESVWDAALFIGLEAVGDASSVATFCALVLNGIIQIFFCWMATGPLIADE
eukprot:gnl/TRDRNA2_/TRDRNA2_130568_c1_seq1.p1 gnl/TRDRNA2_/TRDRNA2_130568_c1~~gnl/TRDRNA2_/TRDRNA2_130568_c1_seq1.p1  ORF type:complete len:279 (+),score=66.84 gnl/TRDRNA2_/TRDRNA2_130568_c1_seq1:56-892(+)